MEKRKRAFQAERTAYAKARRQVKSKAYSENGIA